jgi:hypothetical protein
MAVIPIKMKNQLKLNWNGFLAKRFIVRGPAACALDSDRIANEIPSTRDQREPQGTHVLPATTVVETPPLLAITVPVACDLTGSRHRVADVGLRPSVPLEPAASVGWPAAFSPPRQLVGVIPQPT